MKHERDTQSEQGGDIRRTTHYHGFHFNSIDIEIYPSLQHYAWKIYREH
jgi:hypothetical protein